MADDTVVELDATGTDPSHPCTDVGLYVPDIDLLAYLLQDLRTLIRSNEAGHVELVDHQPVMWTVHGLRRRTVVCDLAKIHRSGRVCVVGFFADRRDDVDTRVLDELELDLLLEFRNYPGILSYSSIELANEYWANLVVHSEPDDAEAWRSSVAHAKAVGFSPALYTSVRIHNGHLDDGVTGNRAIRIDRTKYWDFSGVDAWRAMRQFETPLARWGEAAARSA